MTRNQSGPSHGIARGTPAGDGPEGADRDAPAVIVEAGTATANATVAAEVFDAERPRIIGIAYRLLGSMTDAEDVVQEAWFRFAGVDLATIDRPAAWLTTVVSRIGLDKLRSRQRERADYVGPWLPEPMIERGRSVNTDADDPADRAELADSLTMAFLVLLEKLSPQERVAVLLADVFGEPFSEVARVLDKSESATRQMASRARKKLRKLDPESVQRSASPLAEQQAVADRLTTALVMGDIAGTAMLLAPDVVLLSDGGALVHAARRPIVGVDRVSRFMVNLAKRVTADDAFEMCVVNRRPAMVVRRHGAVRFVLEIDVRDGLVRSVHSVVNPAKLHSVDHPVTVI